MMFNPRTKHLPRPGSVSTHPHGGEQRSAAEFAASEGRKLQQIRDRFGADWVIELPCLNPLKIVEIAKTSPMAAAGWCHQACGLLGRGHHRRVTEYLAVGYALACEFRGNDEHIGRLSTEIIDGRTKNQLSKEKVESDLLHYLFIYIYFQSGMTTRNRATQYAQALQPYFDEEIAASEVEQRLWECGVDRLRRAAILRGNLIRGAREWEQRHSDPGTATMAEVLAQLATEDAAKESGDAEDEATDYGPRGLPPDVDISDETGNDDDLTLAGLLSDESEDAKSERSLDEEIRHNECDKGHFSENRSGADSAEDTNPIDGQIIITGLEEILVQIMKLGTNLTEVPLDTKIKDQLLSTIVGLANNIVELEKIIVRR